MKRRLVSLIFLSSATFGLVACGSGSDTGLFFSNTPSQNSSPAAPANSFSARALLQPISISEEPEKQLLVRFRPFLERDGVKISPDGQFVAYPAAPAIGWTAQLGNQSVLVDLDGSFTFQPPTDGATEGRLLHPSDSTIAYKFTISQLGGSEPLIVFIPFRGSCGMQAGDTDTFCGPRRTVSPRAEARPKLVGVDPATLRPAPRFFNAERQLKAGPLGTEPNPSPPLPDGTNIALECPDTDGIFQLLPSEVRVPLVEQQGDDLQALKYLFSTCHDFVTTHACLNENAKSDLLRLSNVEQAFIDYVPLLYDNAATQRVLLRIPDPFGDRNLHCFQNHKSRTCAQINLGEVAGKLPDGSIVRPTGMPFDVSRFMNPISPNGPGYATVEVKPGESKTLTIHNNGSFGITKVNKLTDFAKGTLTGGALRERSGIQEIRHFLPVDYEPTSHFQDGQAPDAYVTDIEVTYTAPGNAQPEQLGSC